MKLVDMVKLERKRVQELEQKEEEYKNSKEKEKEKKTDNKDSDSEREQIAADLKLSREQVKQLKQEVAQLESQLEDIQNENSRLGDQIDRHVLSSPSLFFVCNSHTITRFKVEKKQMQLEVDALKEDLATAKKSSNSQNSTITSNTFNIRNLIKILTKSR
jgi:DNA repair exonuclease SbcCD ATPase subunit